VAALARKRTAIAVRRPSVSNAKLIKLQSRLAAASKRAGKHVARHDDMLIGVAAAAGLGLLEKKGKKLPTVANIDPALLYGAVAYLGGRKLLGGRNGARLEAAGEALLAVAANRVVARGSVKVAGDELVGDDFDDSDDDDDDDDL
jgi:hypothetical protein